MLQAHGPPGHGPAAHGPIVHGHVASDIHELHNAPNPSNNPDCSLPVASVKKAANVHSTLGKKRKDRLKQLIRTASVHASLIENPTADDLPDTDNAVSTCLSPEQQHEVDSLVEKLREATAGSGHATLKRAKDLSEHQDYLKPLAKAGIGVQLMKLSGKGDTEVDHLAVAILLSLSSSQQSSQLLLNQTRGELVPLLVGLLSSDRVEVKEKAAAILSLLCEGKQEAMSIGNAAALPPLLKLLQVPCATNAARDFAVGILARLIAIPEFKGQIKDQGAHMSHSLQHCLEGKEAGSQLNAATLLYELSIGESKGIFQNVSLLRCLIQVLTAGANASEATTQKVAGICRNISQMNEIKVLLVKEGVLPPLIRMLSSGSHDDTENALKCLQNLSINDENEVLIVKLGADLPLIELIKSDTDLAALAVACLVNLSWNEANKSIIVHNGAVPPLVSLLGSSNQQVKERAAATILYLSMLADSRPIFIDHGAVAALTDMCQTGGSGTSGQEKAMMALKNITATTTTMKQEILRNQGFTLLALVKQFLSCGNTTLQERAVGILINLVFNDETEALCVKCGVLSPLVNVLRSGSPAGKELAMTALRAMSISAENKVLIGSLGAIPLVVDLLKSGSNHAKEQAALLLRSLSVNKDLKQVIANSGALLPLVELLAHGSPGAQEKAAGALQNLSVSLQNQVSLAQLGIVPILVQRLHTQATVASMKEICISILWNLASAGDNAQIMLQGHAVEALLETLFAGCNSSKDKALSCIAELSNVDSVKVQLANVPGLIQALIEVMQNGAPAAKAKAAGIIRSLSVMQDNRALLVAAGCGPPLMEMLKGGSEITRDNASGAIRNLGTATPRQVDEVLRATQHAGNQPGGPARNLDSDGEGPLVCCLACFTCILMSWD